MERLFRMIFRFAALGAVMFLSVMAFIYINGKNDTAAFDEDAVIVLGAAVWGERVSLLLAHRLDKAAEYHNMNPNAVIVVSGGQGEGDITEAEAMRRYLSARNVPDEAIIMEDRATNTFENINFSKEILDELFDGNDYKVVIITHDFHMYRATAMARRAGMDAAGLTAPLRRRYVPWNYTRETAGVMRFWVLGY
jgi:uncharacterized SAM-binding protein YcdF (DUF218 family)